MADTPLEIRRNDRQSRFEAPLEGIAGAGPATLAYRKVSDDVLDYVSTKVPPEARGKGVAGKLVREALDWARGEGYKVIPTCSYVDAWIRRHPDYQDLVAEG